MHTAGAHFGFSNKLGLLKEWKPPNERFHKPIQIHVTIHSSAPVAAVTIWPVGFAARKNEMDFYKTTNNIHSSYFLLIC
jgi:hypothetical protein